MRHLFPTAGLLCVAGAVAALMQSPGRAQTPAPPPAASSGKLVKTAEPYSATFSLRFLKPSQFVAALTPASRDATANLIPSGLLRVSPDDATHRVFVQGTPEAVSGLQQIAQLLDVDPRRVRLTVRILRAPASQFALLGEPDQKLRKGEVVSTAAAVFKNNEAITLHAVGDGQAFHVPLTPHVNSDGSVSVAVDVSDLPAPVFAPSSPADSNVAKKEASDEKRILTRRINEGGKLLVASKPYWKDSSLAYYLEITPVVQQRLEKP